MKRRESIETRYNPTYRVTLTANPTCETKHQIGMALLYESRQGTGQVENAEVLKRKCGNGSTETEVRKQRLRVTSLS